MLFEFQVTVTVVELPVLSTRAERSGTAGTARVGQVGFDNNTGELRGGHGYILVDKVDADATLPEELLEDVTLRVSVAE